MPRVLADKNVVGHPNLQRIVSKTKAPNKIILVVSRLADADWRRDVSWSVDSQSEDRRQHNCIIYDGIPRHTWYRANARSVANLQVLLQMQTQEKRVNLNEMEPGDRRIRLPLLRYTPSTLRQAVHPTKNITASICTYYHGTLTRMSPVKLATTEGMWFRSGWELRVQGQGAWERYGRHYHALLAPRRSYAQGVQCLRRGARVDYPPPHKGANQISFPAGSLPVFHMWGPCRTMPLVGGFSRGSPVSLRPFVTALLHTHRASSSSALKSSLAQTSSLTLNDCLTPECHEVAGPEVWKTGAVRCEKDVDSKAGSGAISSSGRAIRPVVNINFPGAEVPTARRLTAKNRSVWSIAGMKRRGGGGDTGDPRQNPPTIAIVRHNYHSRKSGDPAGDRTRFTLVTGEDSEGHWGKYIITIQAKHELLHTNKYNFSIYRRRVVSPLASHLGELGSIPGRVTGFSHGNHAGRCRWSAGFLGDLPSPPPFHSGATPYSLHSPSSALKTILKAAQISSLTPFTVSLNVTPLEQQVFIPAKCRGSRRLLRPTIPPRADFCEVLHALFTHETTRWRVGVNNSQQRKSSAGMKGRRKREIPEKNRRPTASSGTIPKCENPVTRSGIEPDSPRWEASGMTARPPRTLAKRQWISSPGGAVFGTITWQHFARGPSVSLCENPRRDEAIKMQLDVPLVACRLITQPPATGGGKREIPEKTRRTVASSGTIPTCENPGGIRPGTEPGSPWWEVSRLTAQPPRPPAMFKWPMCTPANDYVWGNSGYSLGATAEEPTHKSPAYTGLWRPAYGSLNSRNFPIPSYNTEQNTAYLETVRHALCFYKRVDLLEIQRVMIGTSETRCVQDNLQTAAARQCQYVASHEDVSTRAYGNITSSRQFRHEAEGKSGHIYNTESLIKSISHLEKSVCLQPAALNVAPSCTTAVYVMPTTLQRRLSISCIMLGESTDDRQSACLTFTRWFHLRDLQVSCDETKRKFGLETRCKSCSRVVNPVSTCRTQGNAPPLPPPKPYPASRCESHSHLCARSGEPQHDRQPAIAHPLLPT
ncbi:hypothetical protein PR048_022930 [Dryococelus australis]|uniref:Uncharacterized protein n=1 Tax=Dryococelus australis TaxID=614101 RepID=A0ABQ9GSQ8_9NEOP|nr:hypothetical protein PR048_022930 [Dryococelus australis]